MTKPSPHGQEPEALIDLIDAYAETRHRCGGIYNARTEAARNAVIEALSGVQALSAAPVVPRMSAAEVNNLPAHVLAKWGTQPQAGAVPQGWKAVPVNPTPEMWKAAKSVPDPNPPYPPHYSLVWDAMLAASPTPPAEQKACDTQLFKFYGVSTTAELIAAQARHIEKLQAKIPPTPSFAPQRVREG